MFDFGRFRDSFLVLSQLGPEALCVLHSALCPPAPILPFFSTLPDDAVMFKSILPSRRVPSSDFHMLTPPVDHTESEHNGKENYFASRNTTYDNNAKPQTEKRKKMKSKGQMEQDPLSTEDFERLLVSVVTS